jgi:hypothetical protein
LAYNYLLPSIGTSPHRVSLDEKAATFKVKPGQLTRWYVVNAGPRKQVFFQFPETPLISRNDGLAVSTLPSLSPLQSSR